MALSLLIHKLDAKRMMKKLNGWLRAALVFSVVWVLCVVGFMAYERFITIGSPFGPWNFFRDYSSLVFHGVSVSGERLDFGLLEERFWLALLFPPILAWIFAGCLVPALRWVRDGFRT